MHTHYPIKTLNSWRLGSTVACYSQPESLDELVDIYQRHQNERTIWLGLGSNILFPDEELKAHIIHTKKALSVIDYKGDFYVEAGVSLAKFARYCTRKGYEDAGFLAGIPGTIGGALVTNAGAYQHEIWSYVQSVRILTKQGIKTLKPSHFSIDYRYVKLPDDFVAFLSARIRFSKGCAILGKTRMKQYLKRRNATQPIGTFNCGCVFRNPKGESAGRLIDGLGLLGYQIGSARVSPMHGNFIENVEMGASSKDIWALIQFLQQSVWEAHGIKLSLEVKVYA